MSTSSTNNQIFDSYAADPAAFDEVYDGTKVREHWRAFVDVVNEQQVDDLNERSNTAQQLLNEHGVTFKIFDDKDATDRPWDMDLLPFIIGPDDWTTISEGLRQRAELLDLVVRDLYGPQKLVKSGQLPPEILFANPGYVRAFQNLTPADKVWLHYCGTELARGPNGRWWVMADRTDVADGAGYALEHRMIASRSMPRLVKRLNVQRLAPYFARLRRSFEAMAPRATETPRVALLSPGPGMPGYFEDQFLARYLGFNLVEGGDLAVRNDHVGLKTLDGLLPIDVIFRRYPGSLTDPLELGGSSPHGVPGLLQAIRAGNVAMVNTPGTRLVETPVFMAFLPKLCQTLLSEDLKMPSIATWWCGDEAQRKFVLDKFDNLVVKPSFSSSGSDEFVISELTEQERDDLRKRIIAKPVDFVAQEKIFRSAAPVWKSDHIECGHIALRTFAVRNADRYDCMPGALVRVAPTIAPMELSMAAGDFSKDAWVVTTQSVGNESLLQPRNETVALVRASSQLPSRSADNLYWFGRQLDRGSNSARVLRKVAEWLVDERDNSDQPEMTALVRMLAKSGLLDEDYIEDIQTDKLPSLDSAILDATFDRSRSTSLRLGVDEIHRLASIVRDRISTDTWISIRRQNTQFTRPGGANSLSKSIKLLDQLLLGLAGCCGLIHDGMVRGPAWQFLDMGRRVERSHWIKNVITAAVGKSLDDPHDVLDALVEVFDCRITYRTRYMSAVQLAPLMDLLLCDETNPGSLSSQVHALSDHIRRLPRSTGLAEKTDEQRYILNCVHRMELADIHSLCAEPDALDQFMSDIVEDVDRVASEITRRYLVHTGDFRQVSDEGPHQS